MKNLVKKYLIIAIIIIILICVCVCVFVITNADESFAKEVNSSTANVLEQNPNSIYGVCKIYRNQDVFYCKKDVNRRV